MEIGKELIERLTRQEGQYTGLKQAVMRQAIHIQVMDIGGLTTDIRSLMRKVKNLETDLRPLRQSWHSLGLDRLPAERREVDDLVEAIRNLVEEIQTVKGENETLLTSHMAGIRKEMSGLQTQGKAAMAYQNPRPTKLAKSGAKFIDRVTG
jgi:chromosome segregation ATPase